MTPTDPSTHPAPEGGSGPGALTPARVYLPPAPVLERPASTAAPGSGMTMNPMGLVRALKRRWFLALTLGLLVAAIAAPAAWFYVTPPGDMVQTLLFVNSATPKIFFPTQDQGDGGDAYRRMQIQTLKTRAILTAVLRHPKVAELSIVREQPEPIEWLERTVNADFSRHTNLMRIYATGDRPDELKILVDVVAETYMEEVVNKEHNDRFRRLDELKKLHEDFDKKIAGYRAEIRNKAEQLQSGNTVTLALMQRLNLELKATSEKELFTVQAELRRLKREDIQLTAQASGMKDAPVPPPLVEQYLKANREIQALEQYRAEMEETLRATRERAVRGDADPTVISAKNRFEAAEKELGSRRQAMRPQIAKQIKEDVAGDYEFNGAVRKQKILWLEEMEKYLRSDAIRFGEEARKQGKGEMDIMDKQIDISNTEQFAKRLATEIEALKVEVHAPPRAKRFEETLIIRSDPRRDKIKKATTAGIGSFCIMIGLVTFWEYRRRRIDTINEVTNVLGLDLVGTVPGWSRSLWWKPYGSNGVNDARWHNLLQESVDSTRTYLMHLAQEQKLRVVMITSAVGSEGKTSLSCHMAASLARAGLKTVLVDWDLRNPSAHRLFELPRAPGLCDVLRNEKPLAEVIRETPAEGLHVLPAGRCDGAAIRGLTQGGAKRVLDELRTKYDFVVVDSSPILPVADSLVVAQEVDAVVLSVLQEVSQMPHLQAAYQRLTSLGVRVLGAVVNGTTDQVYGNKYQYYHYANYEEVAQEN